MSLMIRPPKVKQAQSCAMVERVKDQGRAKKRVGLAKGQVGLALPDGSRRGRSEKSNVGNKQYQ